MTKEQSIRERSKCGVERVYDSRVYELHSETPGGGKKVPPCIKILLEGRTGCLAPCPEHYTTSTPPLRHMLQVKLMQFVF